MKIIAPVLLVAFALTGCAARIGPAVDAATTEGRATADAAAQGNLAILCATTVGAYFRLENPRHQGGIGLICAPGGVPLPE